MVATEMEPSRRIELAKQLIAISVDYKLPKALAKKTSSKTVKEVPKELSEKVLELLRKYSQNWSWRILTLAKPTKVVQKYVSEADLRKEETPKCVIQKPKPSLSVRLNDMAIPSMRTLVTNRDLYRHKGCKYRRIINKHIKRAWSSMFNFYEKKLRDKAKRKQKLQPKKEKKDPKVLVKEKEKLEAQKKEFYSKLSLPKKPPEPDPLPPRKRVKLEEIQDHLADISQPKMDLAMPPRPVPFPIRKAALLYKMTPEFKRLATSIPKRFREKEWQPPTPGQVKKSALTYKISEKVTNLAIPKKQVSGRESDLKEDAFAISPNALKYKASPRILELARPKSYS